MGVVLKLVFKMVLLVVLKVFLLGSKKFIKILCNFFIKKLLMFCFLFRFFNRKKSMFW